MWPGKIVAGRFRIEEHVGSGGMGAVYRSVDEVSGGLVALKITPPTDDVGAQRFEREAAILQTLQHPAVVRYVAHGAADGVRRFLAMEWLEGEDLSERLTRGRLTTAETLQLARHVASALAFAHARGVVHRDIKPANLFVVEGDLQRVRLVDFGISRIAEAARLTVTGEGMGTPAYMAPEQARGERDVGPAADVYSLGCVLFECLAGRTPFVADHIVALLGKVLFEPPPRLSDVWAGASPAVERLLAAFLEKDADRRPKDGSAAASLIEAAVLDCLPDQRPEGGDLGATASPRSAHRAISRREVRFIAAVVMSQVDAPSVAMLRAIADDLGGRLEPVRGGSAVCVFADARVSDGAAQAARFALSAYGVASGARFGIAMAQSEPGGAELDVGRVLDRAADLLHGEALSIPPSLRMRIGAPPPILVDEIAAGLLEVGFLVAGRGAPYALLCPRPPEENRTLLGKRTRCVGREAELRTIEAIIEGAIESESARAVVVTGEAGIGKSRLRVELTRRLREREADVDVWLGRAEHSASPTPFGLLASVIRRLAGAAMTAESFPRQRKVAALVRRYVAPEHAHRVAEFFGEMAGIPFDDATVQLRTARADPATMGDQVRRAWEDFVRAAASLRPVLLILEDVHWADDASLRLVEGVLRNCADLPIAVMVTLRPEGRAVLPASLAGGAVPTIPLTPLGRRAVAELCKEVLGEEGSSLSEEITRLGGGNAFHVEELIRAAASGTKRAPGSVVAMLQARLDALGADERLALRAASVFGERFSAAGVAALTGERLPAPAAMEAIQALCQQEIVERADAGELAFRHALLREAAYGTFPEEERALAHALAARWLAASNDRDALRIAEHADRGRELALAVRYFVRAGERALEAHDLSLAKHCVARGLVCGAEGPDKGALFAIEAETLEWQGDAGAAARRAEEAMALRTPGDGWWNRATAPLLAGVLARGDTPPEPLVDRLLALDGAGPDHWLLLARTAAYLVLADRPAVVAPLIERLATVDDSALASHPQAAGWFALTRSLLAAIKGDTERALVESFASEAMFVGAGDLRSAGFAELNNGCFLLALGDWLRAAACSDALLSRATRSGFAFLVASARANLGLAYLQLGRLDEAEATLTIAARECSDAGDRRMEGVTLCYQAWLELRRDRPVEAERLARRAIAALEGTRPRCLGLATLAAALLELPGGDRDEAQRHASRAVEAMVELGGTDEGESYIRLVHAEVLERTAGPAIAWPHWQSAAARVRERAGKIVDPALRRCFLAVPENARTILMASRA